MTLLKLPPELDVNTFPWAVGSGQSVVDTTYFPLSIVKHLGNDPDEAVIRRFYSWRSHASAFAHANGLPHVVIMDFEDWGVPKPTIRKIISDYSGQEQNELGFQWQFLIVTKPVMRGAITAIVWLRGDIGMYTWAKTYDDAINKAIAEFRKLDIAPPPIDPFTYKFPIPTTANRKEYRSQEYKGGKP